MAAKVASKKSAETAPAEEYDVAISFLAEDQPTAKALADQLEASGLRVFFFPHNQEELAGTNGMESMRAPFLGARVNVVLFKKPWGETPWTRVEDGAISERCFKGVVIPYVRATRQGERIAEVVAADAGPLRDAGLRH